MYLFYLCLKTLNQVNAHSKNDICYCVIEGLHHLYSSPTIVRVIKSRRIRWAGHVAQMGDGRDVYRFWWGNMRERDHWGDQV
jgi:hypothetical protein